jgi:hypothetical protein
MSKKSSDWYVPPDWFAHFSLVLILPAIAILASILLPALSFLKMADALNLFYSGLGIGGFGVALLFFARFPLYRQRKFLTFGLRELPALHRKLYWLAYLFVVASVLLLAVIWLKAK